MQPVCRVCQKFRDGLLLRLFHTLAVICSVRILPDRKTHVVKLNLVKSQPGRSDRHIHNILPHFPPAGIHKCQAARVRNQCPVRFSQRQFLSACGEMRILKTHNPCYRINIMILKLCHQPLYIGNISGTCPQLLRAVQAHLTGEIPLVILNVYDHGI